MSNLRVVRVSVFPHATPYERVQSGSQFGKLTPGGALESLENEVRLMRGTAVYVEMDVLPRDITRDGNLRNDARPLRPGVVLYFTHPKQGPLRFHCDRFAKWYHNVRAIALTLEALRGIERWGAVQDGAQFAGFRALPGATALSMGTSAAIAILQRYTDEAAPSPMTAAWLADAERRARAATHPDVNGGDRVPWDQVESAVRVLRPLSGARP